MELMTATSSAGSGTSLALSHYRGSWVGRFDSPPYPVRWSWVHSRLFGALLCKNSERRERGKDRRCRNWGLEMEIFKEFGEKGGEESSETTMVWREVQQETSLLCGIQEMQMTHLAFSEITFLTANHVSLEMILFWELDHGNHCFIFIYIVLISD